MARRRRSHRKKSRRRKSRRKYLDITSANIKRDTITVRLANGKVHKYRLKPKGHYVKVRR